MGQMVGFGAGWTVILMENGESDGPEHAKLSGHWVSIQIFYYFPLSSCYFGLKKPIIGLANPSTGYTMSGKGSYQKNGLL